MENERIITPAVFALMALLHVGLVSVLWRTATPTQGVVEHIEFIDLGALGGGDGEPEGSAAAVPPPPPKAEPKPKPKVAEPPKPVIKPVVTKNEQADIRQKIEKPKPVEKPKVEAKPVPKPAPESEPKPEPRPQPAKTESLPSQGKQAQRGSEGQTQHEGRGHGGAGNAEGRGSSKGEGSGSNSGNGVGAGGGSGPGSSAGNAIKATGSIPRPPYPTLALENGEEGTVVLKVLVAPNGSVSNVKIAKGSGSKRLDRAASQAARGGRFQPKGWTEYTIPVVFKID